MRVDTSALAPADWDAYTEGHPNATAYHLASAVRIGHEAFGLRTAFLTARDAAGRAVGVLPLIEQSSLLFGRFLVSVPFFTYGGILADDSAAERALVERAVELGRERKAAHVELRHTKPLESVDLPERVDKVSMVLGLPQTEAALSKQLGSKLRSQIKRAERDAPEVVWGGAELLPEFYQVFAATMHDLGTPVYPRSFFEITCRALQGRLWVLVIRVQQQVQAAAILLRHGSSIEVPWAAATPAAKRSAINMRMYWEMLCQSVRLGAQAFDFGRSTRDSGTYRFKSQWGAQPMQLHWHYSLPPGAQLPQLNHANPKYAMAASLWRKMPLWCANLIGPHIIRSLP